jgi:hypothetical protein
MKLKKLDSYPFSISTAQKQNYKGFRCPVCAKEDERYKYTPGGATRFYPLDVIQCWNCMEFFQFVEEV